MSAATIQTHLPPEARAALAQVRVQEWMTPDPYVCSPDTSLADARDMMAEYNCRRLPVVDDQGHLVGIVSLGDLRQAAPSSVSSLSLFEISYFWAKLPVRAAMTPNPITIAPTDTIVTACQAMLQHKISGLPVVVDEKVVGIFTETDVLRFWVSLA
ncbi:MAG: CBS domain-containing protein [Caldilineae bacterium]|nr:MAG: CBS domain-containing protein [Caldilineae bacterium]